MTSLTPASRGSRPLASICARLASAAPPSASSVPAASTRRAPRARRRPDPPSVVAEPPRPIVMRSTPASSAARIRSPVPRVVARRAPSAVRSAGCQPRQPGRGGHLDERAATVVEEEPLGADRVGQGRRWCRSCAAPLPRRGRLPPRPACPRRRRPSAAGRPRRGGEPSTTPRQWQPRRRRSRARRRTSPGRPRRGAAGRGDRSCAESIRKKPRRWDRTAGAQDRARAEVSRRAPPSAKAPRSASAGVDRR